MSKQSDPDNLNPDAPTLEQFAEGCAGYPILLNGDHAEFEREHANTPPKERPDWPLPSFDARDWAEAFCKIAKIQGHNIDEEWMTTWFANALMRGFDEHASRAIALRRAEEARRG